MKKSKKHLKIWMIIWVISNLLACATQPEKKYEKSEIIVSNVHPCTPYMQRACTQEEMQLFDNIKNGDLASLKKIVELTNDHCFCCYFQGFYMESILHHVRMSDSFEIITYYTDLPIRQADLNDLLLKYADKKKIANLLLQRGGIYEVDFFFKVIEPKIKKQYKILKKYGYDFNLQDSITGNTMLMEMCKNAKDYDEKDIKLSLKSLKFLIKIGFDPTIKNFEGKMAIDFTENEKIIAFLKKFENQ